MLHAPASKKILRAFVAGLIVVFGAQTVSAQDNDNQLEDEEITAAVKGVLIDDPGVNAGKVDVDTANGVATLSGTVDNILAKDRSASLAQSVRGVRAVVNQIKVEAPLRTDPVIRQDVTDALLRNPVTKAWEIGVAVEDAEVILTGTVDSWQKKTMTARVAKGVRGVTAIDNQIEVDYDEARADTQIRKEVEARLRWDALVDDAMIEVEVDDAEVTLSGTVASMAEKRQAATDAWVAGVKDVIADELTVIPWEEADKLREDKYETKADEDIRQAIQDAFSYDPRVNMFDLEVSVESGRVTLSGIVNSLSARRAAAQDARNTVGVWTVRNQIQVRPSAGLSDEAIAQRVRNVLANDPYTEDLDIKVRVSNAEVYLNGTVDSMFDKLHAEYVASDVFGVTQVRNRLKTGETQSFGYSPRTDEWSGYDHARRNEPRTYTRLNDWEIAERIRDQLFWSPFLQEEDVTVNVEDGEAHLTGTVDTWGEREAATECAYKGGALTVDNALKVQNGPEPFQP